MKDANGTVTDYTYHPRGWLTASKGRGSDDSSESDESDDHITQIDYWPTGLVKQVTQPDGAFTAFTYDAAHRLTDIADNAKKWTRGNIYLSQIFLLAHFVSDILCRSHVGAPHRDSGWRTASMR